jgi:hypothetical protein
VSRSDDQRRLGGSRTKPVGSCCFCLLRVTQKKPPCILLEPRQSLAMLVAETNISSLYLRVTIGSRKMNLWFWVLAACIYFVGVTSLPTLRGRSLDESRGIHHWSYVRKVLPSETFTARISAQEKDQPDNDSAGYVQKALEYLKIAAKAHSRDELVQPGK